MQIAFMGDVMLGRLVNDELKRVEPAFPWGDILPVLRRADVRVANLEFVLADGGTPEPGKVFHFRSDLKNVASLTAADLNLVSLANNHVLDFGAAALREMVPELDRHGILHAGAGMGKEEARRPAIWRRGDTAVGFLAFTDNEPDWEADSRNPGVFYVPVDRRDSRTQDLLELVRETKDQVQFLIVSAHWGSNWGFDVPRSHQDLARELTDAGADVVFGHSAHIFRGVGIDRRRPLIFSAGDFVDDYAVDREDRNDQSFIFLLETQDGGPRMLRLYPTIISDFQVRLAGARSEGIARRMQRLCDELGTRSRWLETEGVLEIPLDDGG